MLKITQRFDGQPAAILDRLALPYDLRKRGRFKATSEGGREVGVFIERGQVLADGDLLQTDCGQLIQVTAAPEAVVTASTDDWLAFAKVCYHLGNRHVPLEVGDRWLRFQPDHVLQELAERYGLTAIAEQAPFSPENGAYGLSHIGHESHTHGHSHSHGNTQGHSHGHDHDHVHGHSHAH
ncbi:urease accessory protein UreE [Motiliproteus sp. SC1-56]|uniref:urease accessory protein UreE n=1 Tax=Motiliproteus sp. SC1-56 TaxID=2799565 RepID=UPI001A905392|nr:urease accessory protein UreE [Motiliproteus sp. SC1-56]